MKKSVVIAAHPTTGLVITPNANKPEFGTIRVDQEITSLENGFVNKTKRSAFIAGKIEDLKSLGYKAGQAISGQIVRKDSFTPFFEGQAAKINPSTKQEVLINGAKVYSQTTYTENMSEQDVLLSSIPVAAVKEVVA